MRRPLLLALVAGALAILWLGAFTDVDLALARAMYDPLRHTFPWRHSWFAETFSHGDLRAILLALGGMAVLPVLWDMLRPLPSWTPWWRQRRRLLALAAVLVPLTIDLLKQRSMSHCPWDLALFGGNEVYVRLLDAVAPGTPAGKCLPAGHASSALWLVALCAFWLPHRPRMAALAAGAALAFSFGMGWVQQMRGAHFLTHTLWSIWIACAIVGALCQRMLGRELPVASSAAEPLAVSTQQASGS